jgi:hypothetical protein
MQKMTEFQRKKFIKTQEIETLDITLSHKKLKSIIGKSKMIVSQFFHRVFTVYEQHKLIHNMY